MYWEGLILQCFFEFDKLSCPSMGFHYVELVSSFYRSFLFLSVLTGGPWWWGRGWGHLCGTNAYTETSRRCYTQWQVVSTHLAQNAFLLVDIFLQMFIRNFMCKNFFFSLLDRNFFKGKAHSFYFTYIFPQMNNSTVCSSHRGLSKHHELIYCEAIPWEESYPEWEAQKWAYENCEIPLSSIYTFLLPPSCPSWTAFSVLDITTRSRAPRVTTKLN
jgi:hypothetical protein